MKDTRLLDKFNEAKQILCRYDYYIHIAKKILRLTNGERKNTVGRVACGTSALPKKY